MSDASPVAASVDHEALLDVRHRSWPRRVAASLGVVLSAWLGDTTPLAPDVVVRRRDDETEVWRMHADHSEEISAALLAEIRAELETTDLETFLERRREQAA